ncbi:hypothetical protein [Chitinophaga sancti]|uniref:Uncharacterized protein n=1 Tax=Chitinophaga sancti TaxID=1004 RepID=A0A1K1R4L0_9BACT|nr:hypothetical protein [Chitinophaga sancti]WQD64283.1 hypothetical protein U0033_07740 [Chitinophaga sancti]WQG90093.1 hypothetical protein SR876_01180 [Chitinophaga sancti]SFW66787.1 hypothetical protein SAMN05661012_03360 [Chitinophaga sancti]
MIALLRPTFTGEPSYQNFKYALFTTTGGYCHFCEKAVTIVADLFHRSRGILTAESPLKKEDFNDSFLICGDCGFAYSHAFKFEKSDQMHDETDADEDEDYFMKVIVSPKEVPSLANPNDYLWPDHSYLELFKEKSIYAFSWNSVTYYRIDNDGMLLDESSYTTLFMQPQHSVVPELKSKLLNTIRLFRLNGFYHDYPEDTAATEINYYIPQDAFYEDLRPIIRNKVFLLTKKYIDQISFLLSNGINGIHVINEQFNTLYELNGFRSVWQSSVFPPDQTGGASFVPFYIAKGVVNENIPINEKKRLPDEMDRNEKNLNPDDDEGQPPTKK